MIKPIYMDTSGWEHYEVGCIDRDELNKIITTSKKLYEGKLKSITEEKIVVSSFSKAPHLTEKQAEALTTAYKEGYYDYPRKLKLEDLAKLKKRSYSTFQEHLRKAEKKVMDFFLTEKSR